MRRRLFSLALLLGSAFFSGALARTIEILSADRLELRRVDGQELIVISGRNVEIRVDRDTVRASRVEFNRTKRTLTLVGQGTYRSLVRSSTGAESEQVLRGENLVVDLATENLAGEDVIVSTADLEIRGEEVERVPGQLQVTSSYFTPCAKCGRTPNDYAFRANRVFLYPGDRLIAYEATLLLADAPVLYLPIAVLFLNDPDRQPRFDITSSEADGFTVKVGLPFVLGSNAQGFTFLNYYQNRSPSIGFGVDLTAFDTILGARRFDLQSLVDPRPTRNAYGQPDSGYNIDFRVNANGNLPLAGTVNGIEYNLSASRTDTAAIFDQYKGVTNLDFSARFSYEPVDVTFRYNDRFGPDPGVGLAPLRRPELQLDFKEYRSGNFSARASVTVGDYRAAINPLSRDVLKFSDDGFNVSASRLLESHTLAYTTPLWAGAEFSVRNTFTGRYYSTGWTVIENFTIQPSLTQRIGRDSSVSVDFLYDRFEGVSPFQFDAISGRDPRGVLTLAGNTRPWPWLRLGASQSFDFYRPRESEEPRPASFSVSLTPDPLSLNATLYYDFFSDKLERWNVNLGLGSPSIGSYLDARITFNGPRFQSPYAPFTAGYRYTAPVTGDSFRFGIDYDLNKGFLNTVTGELNATSTVDAILNPLSVTATETFSVQNPAATGNLTVSYRDLIVTSTHNLRFVDNALETEDRKPTEKCVNVNGPDVEGCATLGFEMRFGASGAATSGSLSYGGPYDLVRGGWTQPTASAYFLNTGVNRRFEVRASAQMPGLERTNFLVTNIDAIARFDLTPRIGIDGQVGYSNYGGGTQQLTLRPFSITFALGQNERPDLYFTAGLSQTFNFNGISATESPSPYFLFTLDRCCYALQFEINALPRGQGYARLGLSLPTGGSNGLTFTKEGVRFPGLGGSR